MCCYLNIIVTRQHAHSKSLSLKRPSSIHIIWYITTLGLRNCPIWTKKYLVGLVDFCGFWLYVCNQRLPFHFHFPPSHCPLLHSHCHFPANFCSVNNSVRNRCAEDAKKTMPIYLRRDM